MEREREGEREREREDKNVILTTVTTMVRIEREKQKQKEKKKKGKKATIYLCFYIVANIREGFFSNYFQDKTKLITGRERCEKRWREEREKKKKE